MLGFINCLASTNVHIHYRKAICLPIIIGQGLGAVGSSSHYVGGLLRPFKTNQIKYADCHNPCRNYTQLRGQLLFIEN